MKKYFYLSISILLLMILTVSLFAKNKPRDPFGRIDVVDVVIREAGKNMFSLELNWNNDEPLAAITFPLIVKGNNFLMHYDSISWVGRIDYFSVKSARPLDSLQQILIGLMYDLGQGNDPLPVGKGKLATLYFTAETKDKIIAKPCDVFIDTTFIAPSNILYGITPTGQGEVHPAFNVVRLGKDGKALKCK